MPGVPPDAMAQVKKGFKGLFSRKKQKGQDPPPAQQGTATTSTPSKTTTAAEPTPAAALGATSAAPKTEDLPPPPTPAQAPHAAHDVAGETVPPPSHQKATFDPLPNDAPATDPKFSKTTAAPLKDVDVTKSAGEAGKSTATPLSSPTTTTTTTTATKAAAVDPDTGKKTTGPLARVTDAPNTAPASTTTAVVEPPPGAIATAAPGQHPAMSATSGPMDSGEFAEGTHH